MKKRTKILITCLVVTVIVIAVGYPFWARDRERAFALLCRNAIGSLACAMTMYTQSWDDHLPHKLEGMYSESVPDMAIFRECKYHSSFKEDEGDFGLEYLPGLTNDCKPDSVLLFCKKSHKGKGRNVLYWPPKYLKIWDGKPRLIPEDKFQKELKRMLETPKYRKQYTQEAIRIMEKYLEKE